jgi:hypothetical protein
VLGHATAIRDSEGNLINIFQRQEPLIRTTQRFWQPRVR